MKRKILASLLSLSMVLSLAACSSKPKETTQSPEPTAPSTALSFKSGTYTGTGHGNNGEIKVEVTCTEDKITGIQIVDQHETYFMFSYVEDTMPDAILKQQNLSVDVVSGASMSSRGFLNAVENALVQAGADKGALHPKVETGERGAETITVEALVVGAGFAGLTAANRLQEKGVNVLLIEQLDVLGGSARFSGGSFMAATSDETAQAMKDFINTRLYYGDFPVAEGAPNLERIYANIEATRNAYQMFQELGVKVEASGTDGYVWCGAVPDQYKEAVAKSTGFINKGSWTVEQQVMAYERNGGELMTHVKATSLLTDEKGAVIGVTAEGKNVDYQIMADYVILATGSYTHNEALLKEYLPGRAGDYFCTTVGADGSGIEMAMSVGAVMTEDNYLNGGCRLADPIIAYQTQNGGYTYSNANSTVAMIVGRDGARLASEVDDRYFRYYSYEDGLDQFFCVYDSAQLESVGQLESFESLVSEKGPYYKADTLEELGQMCGFDQDTFQTSIEQFNTYCETGKDVFDLSETAASHTNVDNLTGAGSASDKKLPLAQGPYYATKLTFVGFDIIGGIKTGNQGQVLKADGSAVEGLYAVGFTSSRDYMGSGASHSYCLMLSMSSGMVTADDIAANLK